MLNHLEHLNIISAFIDLYVNRGSTKAVREDLSKAFKAFHKLSPVLASNEGIPYPHSATRMLAAKRNMTCTVTVIMSTRSPPLFPLRLSLHRVTYLVPFPLLRTLSADWGIISYFSLPLLHVLFLPLANTLLSSVWALVPIGCSWLPFSCCCYCSYSSWCSSPPCAVSSGPCTMGRLPG